MEKPWSREEQQERLQGPGGYLHIHVVAEASAGALLSFYPSTLCIRLVKHLKKPGGITEARILCLANPVPQPIFTSTLKYPKRTATCCLISVISTKEVDVAGRGTAFLQGLQKKGLLGEEE